MSGDSSCSSSSASGGFRTPEDQVQRRRSQYKSGGKSSTPEWKSTYRKRCMDRLKQSRERLISRFRGLETSSPGPSSSSPQSRGCGAGDPVTVCVEEVMEEEWAVMRAENSTLPQFTPRRKRGAPRLEPMALGNCKRRQSYDAGFDSDEECEDIDYILSIIDELTQELILEEQSMLADCELERDLRLFEESSLCAAAAESLTNEGHNDMVCPICTKNILQQDVRSIYCPCGLQIATIHDGLTLDFLRQQLEICHAYVAQHSSICSGQPQFSLDSNLGMQHLIMNCSSCDFMYIVV